jgi:hypothetical protein
MSVTLHGPRARKKMRGMRGRWILAVILLCGASLATSATALAQTVGPTPTGAGIDAGSADGGLSWSAILTAVLVVLLAGGVVGNLFASKRRRVPKPSVYEAIERRLDSEHDPSQDG